MYAAKVLADSITRSDAAHGGVRLLTVEVTFPRFILAEVNTHRVFSRNSASSRAIPPEKQIERALENPFVPDVFCERIKGMGQGEPVKDQGQARTIWLNARDQAVNHAAFLAKQGISKAHVNRILEPFLWHTAIISSTEWDNFFALRAPIDDEVDMDFPAQPEFQRAAIEMRKAMRVSNPALKQPGEWHLPLVGFDDFSLYEQSRQQDPCWEGRRWLAMVSAGRCARVSFDRQGEYEDPEASRRRAEGLLENGHLSPFEHPATPDPSAGGNFRGWRQYREEVPNESNLIGRLNARGPWAIAPPSGGLPPE